MSSRWLVTKLNNQVSAAGSHIQVEGGTLIINADGSYSFSPAQDWNGTLPVITYTTNTGTTATLTINITHIDDTAPIGADDSATVNEGESVSIDVTRNDSDSESGLDLSSLTIVSGPSNGSFTVNSDGTITYLHDGSDTTSDVFTYTIADANGNVSAPITVNITVNPVDDTAPIGADDSATVNEGESIRIDVTHNDSRQ